MIFLPRQKSQDEVEGNIRDSRENKTNRFLEGLDIKCFVIFP